MKWSENNQSISAGKKEAKAKMSAVDAFSPEMAAEYARRIYRRKYQNWGDETRALEDMSFLCGLNPRSLKRLMKGETKDPGIRVFGRIRKAYLDFCSRQLAELQTELEVEKARFGDAHFEDLDREVSALAEKLRAAKETAKGR
jgi:hypothetical protein